VADRIWLPFEMLGRMGLGMRQVVGSGDRSTGTDNIGVNVGRPIVANGNLRRSCAKVREPSELRFVVVHRVGRGIGGDAACSQNTLGNLVKLL